MAAAVAKLLWASAGALSCAAWLLVRCGHLSWCAPAWCCMIRSPRCVPCQRLFGVLLWVGMWVDAKEPENASISAAARWKISPPAQHRGYVGCRIRPGNGAVASVRCARIRKPAELTFYWSAAVASTERAGGVLRRNLGWVLTLFSAMPSTTSARNTAGRYWPGHSTVSKICESWSRRRANRSL